MNPKELLFTARFVLENNAYLTFFNKQMDDQGKSSEKLLLNLQSKELVNFDEGLELIDNDQNLVYKKALRCFGDKNTMDVINKKVLELANKQEELIWVSAYAIQKLNQLDADIFPNDIVMTIQKGQRPNITFRSEVQDVLQQDINEVTELTDKNVDASKYKNLWVDIDNTFEVSGQTYIITNDTMHIIKNLPKAIKIYNEFDNWVKNDYSFEDEEDGEDDIFQVNKPTPKPTTKLVKTSNKKVIDVDDDSGSGSGSSSGSDSDSKGKSKKKQSGRRVTRKAPKKSSKKASSRKDLEKKGEGAICKQFSDDDNALSSAEIARKRQEIYDELIENHEKLTGAAGNLTKLAYQKDTLLEKLLALYNEKFFDNKLIDEFTERGWELVVKWGTGTATYGSCISKDADCLATINIAKGTIEQLFNKANTAYMVDEDECTDKLRCIQLAFEHELVHVIMLVSCGGSESHHDADFITYLKNSFGHTTVAKHIISVQADELSEVDKIRNKITKQLKDVLEKGDKIKLRYPGIKDEFITDANKLIDATVQTTSTKPANKTFSILTENEQIVKGIPYWYVVQYKAGSKWKMVKNSDNAFPEEETLSNLSKAKSEEHRRKDIKSLIDSCLIGKTQITFMSGKNTKTGTLINRGPKNVKVDVNGQEKMVDYLKINNIVCSDAREYDIEPFTAKESDEEQGNSNEDKSGEEEETEEEEVQANGDDNDDDDEDEQF